ncbi:MAG: hypothetical protein ACP5IL_06005 [Syntrophobacteraceae bacterium]
MMDFRTGQTISEKIAAAHRLYLRWGEQLKNDRAIAARLVELSQRVEASSALSLRAGVAAQCRICEEDEGGSCCGEGIENRYSPELLLINLLFGLRLPEAAKSSKSCYFLGEQGCVLKAREILCINYLCFKLKKTIPSEMLLEIQEVNGAEMDLVFALHERIKDFIGHKSR